MPIEFKKQVNPDQNLEQNPITTNTPAPNAGRVSSFSSGATPNASGSGRFQNLTKYINANEGAGTRIGNQVSSKIGRDVGNQNTNISKQNEQINKNVTEGQGQLETGYGFNRQLGNIGKDLSSFKNMEDRSGFDSASQSAINFSQQPNFGQFQNIQAGSAVDETTLKSNQDAATTAAQNLANQTGQNFSNVNTEQGRYDLLRTNFAPKNRSYTAGNARLDQLLLQASPDKALSSLQNTLKQQNQLATGLNTNVLQQGNVVNKLIGDESSLVKDIGTQAATNQDIFNEKLGQQSNVDYINKLRQDKYNSYVDALKNRSLNQEQAQNLGLGDLSTYNPAGSPNPLSGARDIRSYNLDLSNPNVYLQQGRQASGIQDITTKNDYDAYKALQNISGKDTGVIGGVSTINPSVTSIADISGKKLDEVIKQQNQDFLDKYAGKNFQSMVTASEGGRGDSGFGEGEGGYGGANYGTIIGDPAASSNYYKDYGTTLADLRRIGGKGSGALAYNTANIDDYLQRGDITLQGQSDKIFDVGGDTESNRAALSRAAQTAAGTTKSKLDEVIGQTGVRNQLNINNNTIDALEKARRFGTLV